ncbi:MAG: hypothetical protein H3C59_13245 [Burkholderiaceae bacterium]|nr:hypothetical protein [Burkholderiaceae bacterium]
MNSIIRSTLVVATLLFSIATNAGTQVLGFEIGVSTHELVQTALKRKTIIREVAVDQNRFDGSILATNGESYEIEGLLEVFYIFDRDKRLAAITMVMNTYKFDAVFQALSAKYRVLSKDIPFVGSKSARFEGSDDGVIVLNAPHLGHVMNVTYTDRGFEEAVVGKMKKESDERRRREAGKF